MSDAISASGVVARRRTSACLLLASRAKRSQASRQLDTRTALCAAKRRRTALIEDPVGGEAALVAPQFNAITRQRSQKLCERLHRLTLRSAVEAGRPVLRFRSAQLPS